MPRFKAGPAEIGERSPQSDQAADSALGLRTGGTLQVVVLILIATVCVAVGETFLSVGMRQIGGAGARGFGMLAAALTNPFAVGGTLLMMLYFGLYSFALSMADISFVLPFTALSYLIVAILARYRLLEHVTPTRWIGTALIVLGVVVVGLGERH